MNDIIHISKQREQEILFLLKQNQNTFYVIINGKHIRTLPEYLKVMSEEFSFPIPSKSVDGYLDWIRDLTWIEQENIVLFIENFSHFLEDDPSQKAKMIKLFRDSILPWWDGDVERYVVEGEKRSFQVYLVDADDAAETGRRLSSQNAFARV
ncbi:MAG: barstar family protein [Subdoligranulum sp.]|nr:barstar family protein [Subdoligranulum sp.]